MKTGKLTLTTLITANIIILVVAILQEWKLFDLLFIFWLENVIIGFFNLLKIAFAQKRQEEESAHPAIRFIVKTLLMLFFSVHFYGFCLVHGVFILLLFGNSAAGTSTDNLPELFNLVVNWSSAVIGAATLLLSHGISFFVNYIGKKEYLTTDPGNAMMAPYKRILLVHVVIIGGAFIIANYGANSMLLLLLFFILKMTIDAWRHVAEHRPKKDIPIAGGNEKKHP